MLFKNYRELCKQDTKKNSGGGGGSSSSSNAMDPPKGVSAAFMLACPCMGVLEASACLLASSFARVAPAIWSLSWALVLALLWLVRRLAFVDGEPALAAGIALAGVALVFAAEQVTYAKAARQATLSQGKPAAAAAPSRARGRAIGYGYFAAAGASQQQHEGPAATAAASTKAGVAGASSSLAGNGGTRLVTDPGGLKAVRQAVIRIEAELYGNEVRVRSSSSPDLMPLLPSPPHALLTHTYLSPSITGACP